MMNTYELKAPQPSQVRPILEQHFTQGLEYVAQGVKQLNKLKERLGPNSQQAKKMISDVLNIMMHAVSEFNICIDCMKDKSRDNEIEEANRLLGEYKEELEEMRLKNRQLREIVAEKMENRLNDNYYEEEMNYRGYNNRMKGVKSLIERDNVKLEDLTFGRKGKNGVKPPTDEMYRSGYSQNGHRIISSPNDESILDKQSKSYLSNGEERGNTGGFLKKVKPVFSTNDSISKSPTRNLMDYQASGEMRHNRDSNMKRSIQIGTSNIQDQEMLRSMASDIHAQSLREEISSIDKKILMMMSELYDQYNIDLTNHVK